MGRLRTQRGVGLLEVLIALVIISIGLLGMAGLQAKAVKAERDSFNQTMAMVYAYYLSERVRANGEDPLAPTFPYNNFTAPIANPGTNCDLLAANCTVAQRARQDVFEWQQQVALNLPNANAVICLDSTPFDGTARVNAAGVTTLVHGCDGAAGANYAIKLFWLNNRYDDNAGVVDKTRFAMEFIP